MGFSTLFTASLLALNLFASSATASVTPGVQRRASGYWVESISRQGTVPFTSSSGYKVFRNVKDYGAKGDGTTDDTAAINKAISDGNRCGQGCNSSTTTPAMIYFPAGTYSVSTPILQFYYTQLVGDATNPPTLKATAGFTGMAVIDSDPYDDSGTNWWVNQNNFYRQVRNFVIDITAMPISAGACIHWQVAQATSLQNIVFNMNTDKSSANAQKGIFMDNGSGGFMTDLIFNGGGTGAFIGNQQFTTRNLTFNNCNTAIYLNWCWLWTMQGVTINGGNIGIDMSSGGAQDIQAGSFLLLDSKLSNVEVGINTLYKTDSTMTNNTLVLDNVDFTTGVTTAIQYAVDNSTLLAGGSTVASFAQGRIYSGNSGKAVQAAQSTVTKPDVLLSNGKVFTRSKPQYEGVAASSFVSVKSAGAKGDGATDDTAAIQKVFDSAQDGQVVYFDHGAYLITDTVKVPKNIKITGEVWPLIMASGTKFSDQTNPLPVFQVGSPGDVGAVEMSDLVFQTNGPQPGAILLEWNVAQSSAGAAGIWDVHFRIGGSAGTQLQGDKCTKNPGTTHTANPSCEGAFMLFHITKTASAYVENTWAWVADHELDQAPNNQIDIYNGRGILIESQGPVWLWGTASEHSQLYNYQLSNAKNIFMGLIQTETAYMQGNPDATTPFTVNQKYLDPDFKTSCQGSSQQNCARTWGLRVTNSSDVFVYGGGLYSFFDNYDQTCLETESCQENIVSIENSAVNMFGISTKASVNMVNVDGASVALDKDNRNTFCAAIARLITEGGGSGSSGSNVTTGSNTASTAATSATAAASKGATSVGAGGSTATAATNTATAVPGAATGAGTSEIAGGQTATGTATAAGATGTGAGVPGATTTVAGGNSPQETTAGGQQTGTATVQPTGPVVSIVTVTVTATGVCTALS